VDSNTTPINDAVDSENPIFDPDESVFPFSTILIDYLFREQ
jgi:hypothetical protein